MANVNAKTRRKQFIYGIALICFLSALFGGGWFLSNHFKKPVSTNQSKEPVPDLTGVVDSQFDDKVQRNVMIETQALQSEQSKRLAKLEKQVELLSKDNKQLRDDQNVNTEELVNLRQENQELRTQINDPIASPLAPAGEPVPGAGMPDFIAPPTQYYPGKGASSAGGVTYSKPMAPVGQVERTAFDYSGMEKKTKQYPYIPSGSFARSLIIEGADANASVTGNENTAPMQLRLTGKVQMPNDKEFDLTGCFVSLAVYGDVSSERGIARTRKISCDFSKSDGNALNSNPENIIDMDIAGHVNFMGKNGIKGELVMRNGKILMYAGAAGFLDGIGEGMKSVATPSVGLGATASVGAGDVMKSGFGGGASKAANTLSDYYIKRAEQYHPIIPIGAGNEVTVVFQDGFQLQSLADIAQKKGRGNTGSLSNIPPKDQVQTNVMGQVNQMLAPPVTQSGAAQ